MTQTSYCFSLYHHGIILTLLFPLSISFSQTDVVEVYLDSGHVRIPDTIVLPKLPFEVADQVSHALATILNAKVH